MPLVNAGTRSRVTSKNLSAYACLPNVISSILPTSAHLALCHMQMRGHHDRVAPPGVPPAHPRASSSWRMPTSEFRSIFQGPDPNNANNLSEALRSKESNYD